MAKWHCYDGKMIQFKSLIKFNCVRLYVWGAKFSLALVLIENYLR